MLNLVTGVFVDSAHRLREKDTQNSLIKGLRAIFRQAHGSLEEGLEESFICDFAVITRDDFRRELETQEMKHLFELLNMDISEGDMVYRLLDRKGDGALTCENLVKGGLRLQGPAKAIDLAKMHLLQMEEMRKLKSELRKFMSNSAYPPGSPQSSVGVDSCYL